MKYLYKAGIFVTILILAASCAKNNLVSFHVNKPESIAVQDSVNQYAPLIAYVDSLGGSDPNFRLGAAVSLADYTQQGAMYDLINSNFNQITLGYAMKNGAVLQSDGSLDLSNVKNLLSMANKAGVNVYGHTLVWQENQNAAYLNSLIAPMTVKIPPYPNSLDLSGLKDASMNGWMTPNAGAGISVDANAGMQGSTQAIQLVSSSSSSNASDLELVTPDIPVQSGHTYQVVFYIKSNVAGEGSVSFEGLKNNNPKLDYMGSGSADSTFSTGISWEKISFQVSGFTGSSIKLHLNLGYKPNVTYDIDVNSFYVYDTQAQPVTVNLIPNGDFESGAGGWGGWGGSSSRGVTQDGMGLNGQGHAFYETNPTKTTNYWEVQVAYGLANPLKLGDTYNLSMWIKGDASSSGTVRVDLQSPNYSSDNMGTITVTNQWQHVQFSATATASDRQTFIMSFGSFSGTAYLDNVELTNAAGTSTQAFVVDKTPDAKNQIISAEMQNYIKGMLEGTPSVHAWDVVNEPMSDSNPSVVKTGVGKNQASDEFYWQDYMGKDYAVKAFKWAREYGKNDTLFINDYNLASNLDKCRGLISYVNYIDNNGAHVDGIGTQMHIDINTSKQNITNMFQLLAATGKLIRVSELDIGLGNGIKTAQATDSLYIKQADMYKYVVEQYFKIIPKAQRFGITVWSPLNSAANSSWRPDEPIGLWTRDYNRKRAYEGFAQGLMEGLRGN